MEKKELAEEAARDLTVGLCRETLDVPAGAEYGPVVRDLYIIECCTSGRGSIVVNGREFAFEKGDTYVLLPGDIVLHKTDPGGSRSDIWCPMNGVRLRGILGSAGIDSAHPFASRESFEPILGIMHELMELQKDRDPGAQYRQTSCLYRLLGELLRHAPEAAPDSDLYMERAVRALEMRYDDPNLTVADIASEVGLERCYFSTLFTKKMGVTPHRYLNELRVRKACALITDGELRISEAADAVGIAPENFSRIFKRHTGNTPFVHLQKIGKNN